MTTVVSRKLTRRDRLLLFFGIFAPPIAWGLHLLGGYGYEEAACDNRWAVNSVEWFIVALTVVLGTVAVAGGLASLNSWRELERGELEDPRGRVRFMVVCGLVSMPIFLGIILLGGLMLLFLNPCTQA